jgi:hypothetical protein
LAILADQQSKNNDAFFAGTKMIFSKVLKYLAAILLLAVNACTFQSQANLLTTTDSLGSFSKIYIDCIGTFNISKADSPTITIVAQPAIMENIVYQISDDTLYLRLGDKLVNSSFDPDISIQIYLTVTQINEITFLGSGNLDISNLENNQFKLNQDAVSMVKMTDIAVDFLEMNLHGGGKIQISGITKEQNLSIVGAIEYNGSDLRTEITDATLQGKANAILWIGNSLTAFVGPDAKLQYYGEPVSLNLNGNTDGILYLGAK